MTGKSDPLERVNVNLPRPLLDDLRRLVPRSRRSEVIARATARELRRLKLAALLDDLRKQAAWPGEIYPNLATAEAIDSEVGRLRGQIALVPPAVPRKKARRE